MKQINIFKEMRQNEHLKQAYIFLACAKRISELEYTDKRFFSQMLIKVASDLMEQNLYDEEVFDEMEKFLFTSNYKYILMDFIKEGNVLPFFVGEYPDLELGTVYEVRKAITIS